jgi:hypothetical protein
LAEVVFREMVVSHLFLMDEDYAIPGGEDLKDSFHNSKFPISSASLGFNAHLKCFMSEWDTVTWNTGEKIHS